MKSELLKYAHLRVYKKMSTINLVNSMMCNRLMKMPSVVRNSRAMYDVSSKILGKKFVNAILTSTFCKVLTAGNTLEEANRISDYFRQQKIPVILDYCAQGQLGHEQGQSLLQANTVMFAQSAQSLKDQSNQMISIKITGLINMLTLKLLNDSVITRDKFWSENQENGKLKSQKFLTSLQKMYAGVSEQQFYHYIRNVFGFQGQINKFQIDEIDFKINHQPFYLYEHEKNEDFIIKLFSPFTLAQWDQLYSLLDRINRIVQPQSNNKNGFRILVDAQQSYVQLGIECISEQMQGKYNKQRVYIIPTIQNYLKRSVQRARYQVQIAKRKGLRFSAKLVRGAYIVQESSLASANSVANPVVESFQKTTQNYLKSFQTIVKAYDEGQVIVATHNGDTIQQTQQIYRNSGSKIKMSYAQLLGLADHLTWKISQQNFTVYKYLPWAKTQVMIAYMIRRAEQLNQMRYPLDTQYYLLKQELKQRIFN